MQIQKLKPISWEAETAPALALIADGQRRLLPCHLLALTRRSKLGYDQMRKLVAQLVMRDLVIGTYDPRTDCNHYKLTKAGWAHIGQTPPIWEDVA